MGSEVKLAMKVNGISLSLGIIICFLTLPCDAQEVRAIPGPVVVPLNGVGIVTCFSTEVITDADWLINGTSLRLLNLSGFTQENLVLLRLTDIPADYNNTRIDCVANGVRALETVMLLVQGLLSAVESLTLTTTDEFVFLNWTAPFTLDIAITKIDITYCVEVISLNSSSVLHTECEIVLTEFRYPLLQRIECSQYNFTVTPVNLVGNGTSSNVQLLKDDNHALINLTSSQTTFYIFLSATVCYADLRLEDVHNGDIFSLSFDLTDIASNITFPSHLLATNRQYKLAIFESDMLVSSALEVSTHDVISCSASAGGDEIAISVNFVDNSFATGVLIAFISMSTTGAIDFSSSFFQVFNKTSVSNDLALPLNLFHCGSYVAYAYDIERNQTINTTNGILYQATNCSFNASSNQRTISSSQNTNCSIDSTERDIIIASCPFKRFQALAQLNAQDSVGTLHVNTSEDSETPVTLHVPEFGEYLVTVLPFESSMGILSGVVFSQIQMVTNQTTPGLPTSGSTTRPTTAVPSSSLPSSKLDCSTAGIAVRVAAFVILVTYAKLTPDISDSHMKLF